MEAQTIMIGITLLLAILGWVYMLGFSNARIVRNEKDIEKINKRMDNHDATGQGREDSLREYITQSFDKVYRKIDELPCHKPGWKSGGSC